MNYETTELLREGLTERGIEWRSGLDGVTFVGDWCFVEYDNGKLAATCEPVLTPEQAIAVTLGRTKAKSHPYGYERDTGCYDCTRCECGCINDISARYCNDCGGEIEIDESAGKEIYHVPRHLVFAEKHDDGSLEFCERRYVPESDTHGMLTAEQVLEAIEANSWAETSTIREFNDSSWQAIADELNAELRKVMGR